MKEFSITVTTDLQACHDLANLISVHAFERVSSLIGSKGLLVLSTLPGERATKGRKHPNNSFSSFHPSQLTRKAYP